MYVDMKKRTVSELPNCDVCAQAGVQRTAEFDSPTRFGGSWAYLCEQHMNAFGDRRIGTKLVLQQKRQATKHFNQTPVATFKLTERIVFDIDYPTVKCPWCSEPRICEMDANYTVTCEACGNKYHIRSPI